MKKLDLYIIRQFLVTLSMTLLGFVCVILIVDLIEKVEGPIGLMDCAIPMGCDQIDCCTIKKPLTKINETIINTLKQITLDQIR